MSTKKVIWARGSAPIEWRKSKRAKPELDCEPGVGHGGIHGCDGCCSKPSFSKAWKKIFGDDK